MQRQAYRSEPERGLESSRYLPPDEADEVRDLTRRALKHEMDVIGQQGVGE